MSSNICGICCDGLNMIYLDCDHEFCDNCLVEYIKVRINDRETEILCPYDGCAQKLSIGRIKQILSNDEYLLSEYSNIIDIGNYNVSKCPNCGKICKKDDDSNRIFCENCRNSHCYICKEYHGGWCDESDYNPCPQQDMIDQITSEIESALSGSDLKKCPSCCTFIDKIDGCSAMRCKYCKVKFCWECLKTNYQLTRLKIHDCSYFNQYPQNQSDDEYTSGDE